MGGGNSYSSVNLTTGTTTTKGVMLQLSKLTGQAKSKERLLRRLMGKNVLDFDDLKSVWKMSNEIKISSSSSSNVTAGTASHQNSLLHNTSHYSGSLHAPAP